jgi:predicted trehalose synthase
MPCSVAGIAGSRKHSRVCIERPWPPLLLSGEADFSRLLNVYVVSRAVYQIGCELVHRPEWVRVALRTYLSVTERMNEVRA